MITTNEVLIQKLTWAVVEASNLNPNLHALKDVLDLALGQAILSQGAAVALQGSFLRTVRVMGE